MNNRLYLPTLFLLLIFCSCGERSDKVNSGSVTRPDTTMTTNANKNVTDFSPFKTLDINGEFALAAEIESPDLYPKYADLFSKYGYSGNGYCWEGHITQILEKINPEMLQHIDFDPEAGAFFANVDTKENQLKLAQLLSPIFSDFTKLEPYIKSADRSRIDD